MILISYLLASIILDTVLCILPTVFRYGMHSWRLIGDNEIELIQDFGGENEQHRIEWGDGKSQNFNSIQISSLDLGPYDQWELTRSIASHQYDTSKKSSFTGFYQACCREDGYNMNMYLNIDLRDGNKASPQSAPIAPVMQFKLGELTKINLSPLDPDGQDVTCRRPGEGNNGLDGWNESGIRDIETSTYFDISTDCKLTIQKLADVNGNIKKYYPVQIIMETKDNKNNEIIDSIPLDFSLQGIANNEQPPICKMITTEPKDGFQVNVGQSLTVRFIVESDKNVGLNVNIVSKSEYGVVKPIGIGKSGFTVDEINSDNDNIISYSVTIPDYDYDSLDDILSIDGLQVGAAIQVFDNGSLVTLCHLESGNDGVIKPMSITVVSDIDNDGIRDRDDNCEKTWNPKQSDGDNNGIGDWCDLPQTCEDRCDALSVLVTDIKKPKKDNDICFTYSINRLFDDGECDMVTRGVILGSCDNDDLRGLSNAVKNSIRFPGYEDIIDSVEILSIGIRINFNENIQKGEERIFKMCMRDIFNDYNNGDYTKMIGNVRPNGVTKFLCKDKKFNTGLPCVSNEYGDFAAGGNDEIDDDIDHILVDDDRMSDKESRKWINIVIIIICVISVTFGVIICIICYKQRINKSEERNRNEIANAMKATIEYEGNHKQMKSNTDTNDVNLEVIEASIEDIIR